MDVQDAIRTRCSLKDKLSPKPIEPETIRRLLEAARWAPSARNMQPWRFVVVRDQDMVRRLADSAFFGPSTVVRDAPVLLVVCSNPEDDVTVDDKPYHLYDVGSAVQNVLLAATDMGLVTHPLLSYDEVAVRKILGIPADVRVVIATPLAYPATAYEEASAERLAGRSRRPLDELAFEGEWGTPFSVS